LPTHDDDDIANFDTPNAANMTSRPTVTIVSADGSASEQTHPLPNVFKAPIRPDIVQYGFILRLWEEISD